MNRAKHVQISALGSRLQKREELKFAVRSVVAKFGEDFYYKDVYSELVARQMQCTACGGSYFEKEFRTCVKRNAN